MYRRLLALILAVLFIIPVLAACGGSGHGEDSTNYQDITNTTEPPSDTAGSDIDDDTDTTEPPVTDSTDTSASPGTDAPPDTDAPPVTNKQPAVTDKPVKEETTVPDTEDVMSTPEVATLKYVALGDSICYGYGLKSYETERYSAIIEGYIDLLPYYDCISFNYGVNGQTSTEMLEMIEGGLAPELKDADVVSISIGANNVLGTSISVLTQYSLNLLIADDELRNANNAELYQRFVTETTAGIEQFSHDLPLIIAAIEKYSPDAQIIFQTIYNPYNNVSLSLDFSVATLDLDKDADRLVSQLNEIIKSNARPLQYDVADVYTEFKAGKGYINADFFDGINFLTGLDPHPTAKGHRLIADTVCSLIYTE